MRLESALVSFVLLVNQIYAASLKYKPYTSPDSAVSDLARRVVGNRSTEFDFVINAQLRAAFGVQSNNTHVAKIENSAGNRIQVTASSGVAAAWAFNYYLRRYGKCHISWDERQVDTLPNPLVPVASDGVLLQSRYEYIYMGNPCVYSYSMPFWNWTDWEPFVDWLALNGINLFLMPVGYETALYNMYRSIGLNDTEATSFFVGPAFQAWFEMSNVRNFSGPLTAAWFETRRQLGVQILSRMAELQMQAVLPAFNGMVPPQVARIYPGVLLQRMRWLSFSEQQSQYFVSVNNDAVYTALMREFFVQAASAYGPQLFSTVNAFLIDSFNEMGVPFGNSPDFLAAYGKLVSNTLTSQRADYVWVLQGWMLQGWDATHAHALLSAVPVGRLLVLDLWADASPVYNKFQYFEGHRFLWCMLHNFGGASGMFGNLAAIAPGPQLLLARSGVQLAGIGLTMEGFYQNYALYQLMLDNAYPDSPSTNVSDWSTWLNSFAEQRYGIVPYLDPQYASLLLGWYLAANTIYTVPGGGGVTHQGDDPYIHYLASRPSNLLVSDFQPSVWSYRDRSRSGKQLQRSQLQSSDYVDQLLVAWKLFLDVPKWLRTYSSYQHDLVDLTRQTLSVLFKVHFDLLNKQFNNLTAANRYARVVDAVNKVLQVMEAMDSILGTHSSFMIGPWLDKANAWNDVLNATVSNLTQFNAKSQLTTWGDSPCCTLLDYSAKQWNGLMKAYYLPRMTLFLERLLTCVIQGRLWSPSDAQSYNDAVYKLVELPFGHSSSRFPSVPVHDAYATSLQLFQQFAGPSDFP